MDVGNYSNQACWWLTACTQKRVASLTCFPTSGVSSPLSSPSPISSPLLRSPLLSPSLLLCCDPFFFTSSPSLLTPPEHPLTPLFAALPSSLVLLSLLPSSCFFPSLYPSPFVLTVSSRLSHCRETAVRTLSPLSLATVI